MSLDRIPGDKNLYIGGLFTLRRKEALKKANITHIVSALRLPLDVDGFKHHVVEVDDVEDENIMEHFAESNAFIEGGLEGGGGVLVHCAMGKSRSTTLLIAYLLAHPHPTTQTNPAPLTPQTALALIRQTRPFAEPNPGFMNQLTLYNTVSCPITTSALDSAPEYQRWLYRRRVVESNAAGIAPAVEEIRFEDENDTTPTTKMAGLSIKAGESTVSEKTYRCRLCRTPLAASAFLVPHTPKPTKQGLHLAKTTQQCAHLFLEPLSWMRPELEKGDVEGRLECPNAKCGQVVGRYAWQGMRCSCGMWVVPGISVGRGRVDEIKGKGKGAVGKM